MWTFGVEASFRHKIILGIVSLCSNISVVKWGGVTNEMFIKWFRVLHQREFLSQLLNLLALCELLCELLIYRVLFYRVVERFIEHFANSRMHEFSFLNLSICLFFAFTILQISPLYKSLFYDDAAVCCVRFLNSVFVLVRFYCISKRSGWATQ